MGEGRKESEEGGGIRGRQLIATERDEQEAAETEGQAEMMIKSAGHTGSSIALFPQHQQSDQTSTKTLELITRD